MIAFMKLGLALLQDGNTLKQRQNGFLDLHFTADESSDAFLYYVNFRLLFRLKVANPNRLLGTLKAKLPSWIPETWNVCFICETDERDKPTMDPSSFVKLKQNPERLSAYYKEVIDNIQELQ